MASKARRALFFFLAGAVAVLGVLFASIAVVSRVFPDEVVSHAESLKPEELARIVWVIDRKKIRFESVTDYYRVFNMDLNHGIAQFTVDEKGFEALRASVEKLSAPELRKRGCPAVDFDDSSMERGICDFENLLARGYEIRGEAASFEGYFETLVLDPRRRIVYVLTVPDYAGGKADKATRQLGN